MARRTLLLFLLLAGSDLFAAEPEPQYTRTRQLPALKMSFTDMEVVIGKAAHLLADANKESKEAREAKAKEAKDGTKNLELLFPFRQSSPRESLTIGTGPDEIQIAGHSFPANARLPKAAYAVSYSYSWADAPVSKLDLDLKDYSRRLSVSGTAVDQVEAITAALEGELSQRSAMGGDTVRLNITMIAFFFFLTVGVFIGAFCLHSGQWRYLGVPILCLVGAVLLFVLPLKEVFPGFAMYQGEPSWIAQNTPQIGFVGLIITIILSFVIAMLFSHRAAPPQNDLPAP